jgi:hypothetical protein
MRFNSVDEIQQSLADQNVPFAKPSSMPVDPNQMAIDPNMPVNPSMPGQPAMPAPIDATADEPSLIADLALAPIRGVLGATESVADLVTLGNLPEGTINRLGHSKTMAGSVVENATDFLVGFTPVFGWLGRASKLGKLAKLGKVGNYIAKSNVAKGAIAGAVADFSVFDEHQDRLSNLIESVPQLQNPVTEYLASNQEDSIFEGRLKNAVEGLLAGGVVDGLISGVKALRGAKRAMEAGDSTLAESLLSKAGDDVDVKLKQEFGPTPLETPQIATQAVEGVDAKAIPTEAPKDVNVFNDQSQLEASTFLGNLPKTGRILDMASSPEGLDMTSIEKIREAVSGDAGRPIVNIFLNSGPASTHKATTAFVNEFANELMAKKVVTKPEVVAKEIEQIKRLGGEDYIKDLTISAKNSEDFAGKVMGFKFARMDVLNQVGEIVNKTISAKEAVSANPGDATASLAYREGFIRLNELMPKIQSILFGEKQLRSNLGRGLAMAKNTAFDAKMAEEFINISKKWASEPAKMGQYETALAESIGNGDAKVGRENFEEAIRRFATIYNKHGADGIVNLAPDKFWMKLHNEWWINALLSGPKTFAVNAIGNLISTAWKPMESVLGSQIAFMKTGNPIFRTTRNAFLSQYGTMIDSAKEAFISANNAFKTGESALVQGRTAVEQYDSIITKENFQAKLDEIEAKHPDASPLIKGLAKYLVTDATTRVGNAIRMPSKALLWMDEFTKHLNFRSVAKSRALAESYDEGWKLAGEGKIQPEQVDEWVAQNTDKKINDLVLKGGGLYSLKNVRMRGALEGARAGKNGVELEEYITDYVTKNYDENKSNLAQYAYGWAEEVTFTKRGEDKTIQRMIENGVREHPSLRLVVPFVTTPTRIIKFFSQRAFGAIGYVEGTLRGFNNTPLEKLAPELTKARLQITKELYSSDPFVRAQAEGKVAMGVSVMATAVGLWNSGSITGQGPSDEKERVLKQATGWQPYSLRFKMPGSDKYQYVSYQRFDPLATFLGVVADFSDKVTEDKVGSKDWINFMGSAIGTALSKNITSKSYLTGIEQIMDAVNQPDRKMSQFISTRLGSLVVPSLVSQVVPSGDPVMREARTFLDMFTKKIPGLSTKLEPKRNILGEPIKRQEAVGPDFISPLFYSEQKKDKVMDELANLRYSFSMPPVVESGGVDLSKYRNGQGQTAYDRYIELTGQVKLGNKDLRQALNKLVTSPQYLALAPDPVEGLDSPRVNELKKVIGKYRATAKEKMLKEYPELYGHRVLRDKLVMARRQGKVLEAQEVLSELQNVR